MNRQGLADALRQLVPGGGRRAVVAQRGMVDDHLLDGLVVCVQQVHGIVVRDTVFHGLPRRRAPNLRGAPPVPLCAAARRGPTHVIGTRRSAFTLLLASVVFDGLSFLADGTSMPAAAYWMLAAGIVGGLVTAPFGLIDLMAVPPNTRASAPECEQFDARRAGRALAGR